jgi:hypothetical protein
VEPICPLAKHRDNFACISSGEHWRSAEVQGGENAIFWIVTHHVVGTDFDVSEQHIGYIFKVEV